MFLHGFLNGLCKSLMNVVTKTWVFLEIDTEAYEKILHLYITKVKNKQTQTNYNTSTK